MPQHAAVRLLIIDRTTVFDHSPSMPAVNFIGLLLRHSEPPPFRVRIVPAREVHRR
jgi:hypothetical protein